MAEADTLEIVSFAAGACRFAVEAQQIEALLQDEPGPAVDVEALLRLPRVEAARRRCLRIGGRIVRVSEPLDLRSLPVDRLFPLPELVALRIRIEGVRALALDAHGAMLLLDLQALLVQRGAITSG